MAGHCLLHIRDGEVDEDVDAVDGLHGYASKELCTASSDEYSLIHWLSHHNDAYT